MVVFGFPEEPSFLAVGLEYGLQYRCGWVEGRINLSTGLGKISST